MYQVKMRVFSQGSNFGFSVCRGLYSVYGSGAAATTTTVPGLLAGTTWTNALQVSFTTLSSSVSMAACGYIYGVVRRVIIAVAPFHPGSERPSSQRLTYSRSPVRVRVIRLLSLLESQPAPLMQTLSAQSSGSPLFWKGAAPQGSREVPPLRHVPQPENRSS